MYIYIYIDISDCALTLSLLNALFLRKKNKQFLLKNAVHLTHVFLYDNFNKKI